MANDGKHTVEQLGQLAKQKYPDKYQGMDDSAAGAAVVKEYPQYNSYLASNGSQPAQPQSEDTSYTIQQLGQMVKQKYPKKYGSMDDSTAGAKLLSDYPQYNQYLKKKGTSEPSSSSSQGYGIPAPGSSQDVSGAASNLPLSNSPLNPNLPEGQNPAAQANQITPGEQSINGSIKVPSTPSETPVRVKPISPIESLNGWMKHSLGDATKNASTSYPIVNKQQKSELLQQRAALAQKLPENPNNQEAINNIDNTLSLYSPEAEKIYQDTKKSVGDNQMNWFITPQQQQETKQQLLAKYGTGNESIIDNVINFFNTTNSRKAFYDTGKALDKQEGVTDKEQEANYNMAVNNIFSGKEGQAEEEYTKIKQQMTSASPDKEEINQAHGKLNSLGYNASHWKEYKAGYRIVKKDETPTGYDNLVNNYVNHYIGKKDLDLQEIAKKNFTIYKALQAKVNQLKPVIQQINENKLNSMLPKENAQPLKPINIQSLTGGDYAAKVKGEAAILNPSDPTYQENVNRIEQQYKSLTSNNGLMEQAQAAFEASVRATKVKQHPVSKPNIDNLLKDYEVEKKQFEKQPVLKGGTLGEIKIKGRPSTSYWYEAAQHPTSDFGKLPEKTQKFLMAIANQRKSDVVSGSILEAESIKKVAPESYIKAVEALKKEAVAMGKEKEKKAEWFKKTTLDKMAAAATYQNPELKRVQQSYMSGQLGKMTTPVYQETGKPSEKTQQQEEINKDADTIGKLSSYATLLEGRIQEKDNPNLKDDIEKYKEVLIAYSNIIPKYHKAIEGYQGKLKEFPYYVPRNDVHILSKLTGLSVGFFATLNSSIIGKAVSSVILGNPDFRNYDPSGLVKAAHGLIGLMYDAPLFWGIGEMAGGLTDAVLKGMSKIKLTEGIAGSINDLADATKVLVGKGMTSADAVAEAAIELPKDALRIKAAIMAMSAAKQGMVLSAYNTISSVLSDLDNIRNATQGSKVKYKGTLYTIFKSDGDKVRMIDGNGNEKELTRAEYNKLVHLSYGGIFKSGAVGLVGGALMPEAKLLSESLMKAAGITEAFPNSVARIATQAYAFAAAGSLIEKHELPTLKDYKSAVIFFAGMEAGAKVGEVFSGKNPFAKYFKGGQKNLNNEELVKNIVEIEKAISKDNNFGTKIYNAIQSHGADLKAADMTKKVVNLDGDVVKAEKDGKGVFVTYGAKIGKDGEVHKDGKKAIIIKTFNPETGDFDPSLADAKDLKVVSVQKEEEFKKELADHILKKGEAAFATEASKEPLQPSSNESGTIPTKEGKSVSTEAVPPHTGVSDKTKEGVKQPAKEVSKEEKPVEPIKTKAVKEQKAEPKQKEPWEMTLNEFKQNKPEIKGYKGRFADGKEYTTDLKKTGDITLFGSNDKRSGYKFATAIISYEAAHKFVIEQALSEGKPVPEEVLKEYPDLKKVSLKSKVELRKQKFTEIDNELSDEISKLASSLGIVKNLTGEQRDKLIPIITKITKLLADKLILKGQELKDAVLEYLKHIKIPVDEDVKGIVQDNVDKLNVEAKKEEPKLPKEENVPSEEKVKEGRTSGINARVQREKALARGDEPAERMKGRGKQASVYEGRRLYDAMTNVEKDAYFKDLKERLNIPNPSEARTSENDLMIARAHSSKLEDDYNLADDKADEAKGAEKKKLREKADDVLRTREAFLKDVVNHLSNKWGREGQAQQGEEDIETGKLAPLVKAYTKTHKKPITDEGIDKLRRIAKEIRHLNEADKSSFRKMILGGFKDEYTDKKPVAVSLREVADGIAGLRKQLHRQNALSTATPLSLALEAGLLATEGTIRAAAKGVEAAVTIEKAISDGIKAIRGSEWYKKLSGKEAKDAEDKLTNMVDGFLISKGIKAESKDILAKDVKGKDAFTAKEARKIWQYTKDNYVNDNETGEWTEAEYQDVLKSVGEDLGLKPEDVEKAITQPKTEINLSGARKKLLDIQRKFMSTARKAKTIRDLPDIYTAFANKKGNNFTIEERRRIWDYTKEFYVDLGITDMGIVVSGISSDLGLTTRQAIDIFAGKKSDRTITNEMWDRASRRRRIIQNAKNEMAYGDSPLLERIVRKIPRLFFSVKVLWHFGVGGMTHAGMYVFTPTDWVRYVRNFGRQYKLALNPRYYEKMMMDLKLNDHYTDWKRAQLAIEPDKIYTDYELWGKLLGEKGTGKFIKNMNEMGTRGFAMLKLLRFEVAERLYKNWSSGLDKSTPEVRVDLRKMIAEYVNHSTGASNIKFSEKNRPLDEVLAAGFFAWRLEASRWARLIKEPYKATMWLRSKDPNERAMSKIIFYRAGQHIATYGSMLALNQAMLTLAGSKHKINFTNPEEYDWLKFKVADYTLDMSGGIVSALRFAAGLAYTISPTTPLQVKGGRLQDKEETIGNILIRYLIGKSSPFAQFILALVTKRNFNKRETYSESATTNKYQTNVGWGKLGLETVLPIPFEEGYNVHSEGVQRIKEGMMSTGMKESEASNLLGSIVIGGLTGLTGIRIGRAPEAKTPFQRALEDAMRKHAPDLKKAHEMLLAAGELAKGDVSGAVKGIKSGLYGGTDLKKIQKESQPDIVKEIQAAPLEVLVAAYPKAKGDVKRWTLTVIATKFYHLNQRKKNMSRQQVAKYDKLYKEFTDMLGKDK